MFLKAKHKVTGKFYVLTSINKEFKTWFTNFIDAKFIDVETLESNEEGGLFFYDEIVGAFATEEEAIKSCQDELKNGK